MVRSPPPPRRPAPPRPATGESKPVPKHVLERSRCWKCGQYGHWGEDCPQCEWEKEGSKGAAKKKKGSKKQEIAAKGEYGARGFIPGFGHWTNPSFEEEDEGVDEPLLVRGSAEHYDAFDHNKGQSDPETPSP